VGDVTDSRAYGSGVVRFNGFEADRDSGELRKHGVRIRLRDQSFAILSILLDKPGKVVTRERLRDALWPEGVFVDYENNLNTAVARLREALGDSSESPRFIETLPRRGYRFIAPVCVLAPLAAAPAPGAAKRTLLVLPFVNLSGDPGQEYFSDAMTEELITELAAVASVRLGVFARTTSMHYKGSPKPLAQIARETGASYVVEGSARLADERILLCVQLIQMSDQMHLWAKRFQVGAPGVFAAQAEAAHAIAAELGLGPDAEPPAGRRPAALSPRAPPRDPAAYHDFLRGRHYLYQWTPEAMARARECFERAIRRDPEYAQAYDSVAELCWYAGFFGILPPQAAFSAGLQAVQRAIAINESMAEAHALLGMFRKELDYDWPGVRAAMARALELDPGSPVVLMRHAVSGLMPHGYVNEAAAELENALESDPMSSFLRCWLATMFHLGRRYERGLEQARLAIELSPQSSLGPLLLGQILRETGSYEEAIDSLEQAVALSGGAPMFLGWLGLALGQAGRVGEARALLGRLEEQAGCGYVLPSCFGWLYLGLGELDLAFSWLDRAVDERDAMVIPIKTYPFLDTYREDPRYRHLLARMNLRL
jgi:TolB-like protein/Tfp pilus assembly protein PilF